MSVTRDLRDAARALRRAPGFTVAALAILSLGIGAALTVFSLVSALLLTPPSGVAAPARLALVWGRPHDLSYPDLVALRAEAGALAAVAGRKAWDVDLTVGGTTRPARGAMVSPEYFAVLAVAPSAGRLLLPGEEAGAPGAHPVVVISAALWRSRFGADPAAVGSTVRVNSHPFTVVGVAAPGFQGIDRLDTEDLWVPLDMYAQFAPGLIAGVSARWPRWLSAVGRLRVGARLDDLRAETAVVAGRLSEAYAENRGQAFAVKGLMEAQREGVTPYLALLGAIAAATLLIACVNVAGLELARASARRREVAVRAALGAARARLVRGLLIEGLLVSVVASAVALVATEWATRAIAAWVRAHAGVPSWLSLAPDARVAGGAVVAAIVVTALFAAAPALQATRMDLATALKDGVGAPAGVRLRRVLLIAQAALSLVLVAGSGALAGALRDQLAAPLVTAPANVLQARLEPSRQGYGPERAVTFYETLAERIAAAPGVEAVSFGRNTTPRDQSFFAETVVAGLDTVRDVNYDVVGARYFRTVGSPLVAGRDFTADDRAGAPLVAVVNRTLARRLWHEERVTGRRLRVAGAEREVVGVAPDRAAPGADRPFIYLPLAQPNPWSQRGSNLLVRTALPAAGAVDLVRRTIAAVDPSLPVPAPRSLDQVMRDDLAPQLLASRLAGGAGLAALLLSALGIYGMVAYLVSMRQREFAVRAALGASRGRLRAQVLREGGLVAAWGVALGAPAAFLLTPAALAVLYGSRARISALAVAGGVILLVLAGAAGCVGPARRAARVDPMRALRSE